MSAPWEAYDFRVQMPHMAPGEKLSEVEFLKIFAACQWESIARALGRRPQELVNEGNERLYGSVIDVEIHLGQQHGMEILGEDVIVHIRNRVRFYAKKFVEGLFVIDDKEIGDERLGPLATRQDLRRSTGSWACMTNAFIARAGGNAKLKVFRPAGVESADAESMTDTPLGIIEQGRVQQTGVIEGVEARGGIPLEPVHPEPIRYPIVIESDLNGASLVYFARYEAMMNYGERLFLSHQLATPMSTEMIAALSTEHRRAYFFANAGASDEVELRVSAELLPPGSFEQHAVPPGYRVPFQMRFRIDLYRCSDNVLMATSVVRKSLNVPGSAKAVLNEASRLLHRIA